jgi:predicted flap endonuclease-1-like 5' DNA nuclease
MLSSILSSDFSCELTSIESEEGIPMASKRSPTNRDAEPPRIDDLKQINGIGQGVEKRLNGVGIFTFVQLAALPPADIAAAVAGIAGLSAERIIKQDWIGQARKLAAESLSSEFQRDVEAPMITRQIVISKAPVKPPAPAPLEQTQDAALMAGSEKDVAPSMERYHPATFTVELLLNENNIVHNTHALHVQSRREQTWMGWQKMRLLDFLSVSAGLNITSEEPALPSVEEPDHASAVTTESKPFTPITASSRLAGTLRVREMEMVRAESNRPSALLSHDERFDVRLILDLTELQAPGNTPLNYKASIYGRGRGPGSRSGLVIGEAQGTIIPADTVTINIEGNTLPEGAYQLAATVILGLPTMKLTPRPGTTAIIDGGQVQVY